jgi:hypothetical protein
VGELLTRRWNAWHSDIAVKLVVKGLITECGNLENVKSENE